MFSQSEPGASEFFVNNATLAALIQMAFGSVQVKGEPEWFHKTHYAIRAKTPEEQKLTPEQNKMALQRLLHDRLHLQYHTEVAHVPGYGLAARKDGPKLEPTKGGPFRVNLRAGAKEGRVLAQDATMEDIAQLLGRALDYHPVVDTTGLTGKYDLSFSYAPPLATDSTLPSLWSILKDNLGLEFVKKSISVQTLVIDSVDQTPSEN